MKTDKLYNILQNLNNLEESYMEYTKGSSDFSYYKTYKDFIDSYFIKKNNLAKVYWPQLNLPEPKLITEIKELDESLLILSNLNFALSKQINFPYSYKHPSNYFNFVYIYIGLGVLELEQHSFQLQTGDFFIIPPKTSYSLNMESSSIGIHIMVRKRYINSQYLDLFQRNAHVINFFNEVLLENSALHYILFHTKDNEDIREVVLNLFAEYLWGEEYQNELMECYLKLLFTYLLRHNHSNIESSVTVSNAEMHYNILLNYLQKNYQIATLNSTADHIHFSKQYICRIIKNVTGKTFSSLLTEIKLENTKSYLMDTNLNLAAISELTGFSDASHLSRVFKQQTGLSPSVYRLQNNQ